MLTMDTSIQAGSLLVLAATVYVSYRQARASERTAKLSMEQTELTRAQLHATFRPIVEVTGEDKTTHVMLTLKNIGTSPALALTAICRSGSRDNLGNLPPGNERLYRFDNSFNVAPPPAGPPEVREQFAPKIQSVPLRLEYKSVTGASYWTAAEFSLGHEGPLDLETEYGMDFPDAGTGA